jgi:hypothetical protein
VHDDLVKLLLLAIGANIEASGKNFTPLLWSN